MAARPLTPKQEKFAQLYVELGNASEAYRRVYAAKNMKPETVNRNAFALLQNSKISARVQELGEKAARPHEISSERVMGELAKIAFADLEDFVQVSEDGDVSFNFAGASKKGSLAAMSEFTQEVFWEKDGTDGADQIRRTRFKLHDKIRALELIGKRMAMWVERHSVEEGGLMAFFKTLPLEIQDQVIAHYESRRPSGGRA